MLKAAEFPAGLKKDIVIPIDEAGRMMINFAGPWNDSYGEFFICARFFRNVSG
jgi:hypothetical protein